MARRRQAFLCIVQPGPRTTKSSRLKAWGASACQPQCGDDARGHGGWSPRCRWKHIWRYGRGGSDVASAPGGDGGGLGLGDGGGLGRWQGRQPSKSWSSASGSSASSAIWSQGTRPSAPAAPQLLRACSSSSSTAAARGESGALTPPPSGGDGELAPSRRHERCARKSFFVDCATETRRVASASGGAASCVPFITMMLHAPRTATVRPKEMPPRRSSTPLGSTRGPSAPAASACASSAADDEQKRPAIEPPPTTPTSGALERRGAPASLIGHCLLRFKSSRRRRLSRSTRLA